MLIGAPRSDELGFSLNPLHYVKKAAVATGHGVSRGAHAVGHGAVSAANAVGHGIKVGIIKPFEWVASKVTAPIRNRVHQLRDRRAGKLAWDRRKSKTPNASERAEAKAWTKNHLKKQGPHGEILQLFAGSTPMLLGGGVALGDPVTISLIAASVPVFMALMNTVLKKANNSGEAPANPAAGGSGKGGAPGPAAPGTVDLTPVQDAAAAAAGGDAGGGDAAGGGGKGKHGGGGGQILGMPKKYVMIGGAVLGGVLVLSLLTSKKGT